jgi:hypothetical protein
MCKEEGKAKRTDETGSLGGVVLAYSTKRLNLKLGALKLANVQFGGLAAVVGSATGCRHRH